MPAENIELLIEFTHDDDPRARAMAVAGLAKLADARGFAPVLVCLFDPVDEVRAAAATALGIFGDDRAFEALVECLGDPNERVGVNCAWSLGQIPTTRCLDKLCEVVADNEVAPAIRVAAATAIGERSELPGFDITTDGALIEQARVALLDAMDDEEGELRAACIWTLGHFPVDKQTTERSTTITSGSCATQSRHLPTLATSGLSSRCSSCRKAKTTKSGTSHVRLSIS